MNKANNSESVRIRVVTVSYGIAPHHHAKSENDEKDAKALPPGQVFSKALYSATRDTLKKRVGLIAIIDRVQGSRRSAHIVSHRVSGVFFFINFSSPFVFQHGRLEIKSSCHANSRSKRTGSLDRHLWSVT